MKISRWNQALILIAVALTILALALSLTTTRYPVIESNNINVGSYSILGVILCLVLVFIRSRYESRKGENAV